MPNTEPNSLPWQFDDWRDWRRTYTAYVEEFKVSAKDSFREALLEMRLRRLGFVGVNLDREIEFIKENT
jgi:hypothetical protein